MVPPAIQLHLPHEMQRLLADRLRELRLGQGLKQSTLAQRAGVSLASLRRFERVGEVSLKHFMRLCHALGRVDEFDAALKPPSPLTMAQLEAASRQRKPQRGRS